MSEFCGSECSMYDDHSCKENPMKEKKGPKVTMAEQILRFIASDPNGKSYGQIQRFIVVDIKGRSFHPRRDRGQWSTNLTQVLGAFCVKGPDRRYRVTEPIKSPFFGRKWGKNMTRTAKWNRDHSEGLYLLREARAVKCPNCDRPDTWKSSEFWVPGKDACFSSGHAGNYRVDCRGRVWYTPRVSDEGKRAKFMTSLTGAQMSGYRQAMEEQRKRGVFGREAWPNDSWGRMDQAIEAFVASRVVGNAVESEEEEGK